MSLVEVRAGHVIAAGRVRADELALALEQDPAAVWTDALGMTLPGRRRRRMRDSGFFGLAAIRRFGFHEAGLTGSAAAEGVGAGVTAAGVSASFKARPAGVRRSPMGVLSGVGGAD